MSVYVELFGPLTPAAHATLTKLFRECPDPLAGVPGPWNGAQQPTTALPPERGTGTSGPTASKEAS